MGTKPPRKPIRRMPSPPAREAPHTPLWAYQRAYQPTRSIRTHAIPAQIPKVIASMREAGKNVMASFLPARMSETDDREALFRGRHCLFCRGAFRAARSSQPFDRRRDNEIEPIWFPQRHVSIAYVLALNAEITRRARAKKVSPAGGTAGLWGLGSNYREGDRRLPSQNYNGAEDQSVPNFRYEPGCRPSVWTGGSAGRSAGAAPRPPAAPAPAAHDGRACRWASAEDDPQAVGARWFRKAGGMRPAMFGPSAQPRQICRC
jgi:hypothetical protein